MDEAVPTYVSFQKQVFNSTACESDSFISSYSLNMELVHTSGTSYIGSLKDVGVVFGDDTAALAQCTTTIEPGVSYSILY